MSCPVLVKRDITPKTTQLIGKENRIWVLDLRRMVLMAHNAIGM